MARTDWQVKDVIGRARNATSGTLDDTSQTRVQADLIGKMLAGALTRYLNAVTPRGEIENVADLFRDRLH